MPGELLGEQPREMTTPAARSDALQLRLEYDLDEHALRR